VVGPIHAKVGLYELSAGLLSHYSNYPVFLQPHYTLYNQVENRMISALVYSVLTRTPTNLCDH